jgi:hypothetical protein
MNSQADIAVVIAAAADPVVERAERQLAVVGRLVEIGMELVEDLRRQVCDGGTLRGNPWLAFEKIARTVRQSIMLEMRIDEALRDWLGLSEAERAERRASAARSVAPAAMDQPDAEILEDKGEAEENGRLEIERGERAERGERPERFWADRYVIEDEQSFRVIVGRICNDLGVTPDWNGWDDDKPGDLAVRPGRRPAGRWEGGESSPIRSPLEGRRPRLRGPPG